MKVCKKYFVNRARMFRGALFICLLAGHVIHGQAQTATSAANGITYTAGFDTGANALTSWTVGGVNQLVQQSLYYSLNNGPVMALTGSSASASGSTLTVSNYIANTISVVETLKLNGANATETIKFYNETGANNYISIFQYSDFVMGGSSAAGSQNLNMTTATGGGYAIANQTGGGGNTLNFKGFVASGTTEVQADSSGAPFGAFLGNASPTTLDNTTLNASGNAVFGYEFDGNIAAGNALTISEVIAVPEPSSVALVSTGMLGLVWLHRRGWRRVS